MSYSINGKIFTSHALMDEIIYNTKILVRGLVLKNEKLANQHETEISMEQADYYIACLNGTMELSFFPLTKEILMIYGCTELQAQEWCADRDSIPEELRDEVLTFCCNYFIENYVEYNDYYRKLHGEPEYSAEHPNDYNVTLSRYNYYDEEGVEHNKFDDLFAKDYSNTSFDYEAPLHTYTVNQINTLEGLGILDAIREIEITNKDDLSERTVIDPDGTARVINDSGKHYKYLDYLGSKSISYFNARTASNWDILYMPAVEYLVEDRFKELYSVNKQIYERRTYQLAYTESSDYFEEMIILLIISQTFADMIVDAPEWYIRRDVFDLRTVQYFLDSQGVKFFEDIPMKYQIRIVKGMNKLIRYKSTDRNIFDILEIFDISGIVVYKYYLMKHYLRTDVREFIVIGKEDPEWSMEAEYDFGFEDEEDIGDTGDGHGGDVPGSEVYDFVDMSDEEYVDPDADYDYYYDFRSEDDDYWDESAGMLPEYDFYDEDEFPDEINNTGVNPETGYEDYVTNELFDFGLLAWDVIEDYDERTVVYDFNSEDSGYVNPTETTDKLLNYQEKIREIKDEFGNVYELQFIKTPVGELYDDYVKNTLYREPYDDIVSDDKYWDGEDVHYYVRNQHLNKKFTIEGTKYMGIEYNVNMTESLYEKEYYLGTLLNARIDTDEVLVSIPQLSEKRFTLLNLLLFVYCCNGIYTDTNILVQDTTQYVVKRTEEPPEFDPYTDYDGGYAYTYLQPPEPEPEPEPFYGYDDFGDEDNDDIDPDTIEIIWDFGYNYYIDWETEPEYRNYDYGEITADSDEDEYTPGREIPAPVVPDSPYYFDQYVYIDPKRPYYYLNQLYVDQTNGELTQITVDFIDSHPELIGTNIYIVFYWTGMDEDMLGYYTLDVDNHEVDNWNDRDQYELHVDGGDAKYSSDFTRHYFYDYIRTDHPELYVDCVGRIYGFNMANRLEDIAEAIGFRHSEFGFERAYTLADCGVDIFISKDKFTSIEDLYNVYQNNTECYKKLLNLMINANTRDERRVFEYVYMKLFTLPWDTAFYILQNGEMAENYAQILEERDYTLYTIYQELLNEGDSNLRIFNVRNCLNDIADTLNYFIHGENLKYVLSFISTISYDALLHYVHEMINFFKSWKMHFLDPILTYTIDAKNENSTAYGDQIVEYKIKYWTPDTYRTTDSLQITPLYYVVEKPGMYYSNYNRMAEVVDLAAHYVNHDPLMDPDFNGGSPEDEESYYDLDGGGVHLLTDEQLEYAAENDINVVNLSCWPCYNVDAGEVAAGIDIYDFDGGGPVEVNRYIDLDGLEINDPISYVPQPIYPYEQLPGYEHNDLVAYDIEGGRPDIHLINEGSIRIKIDRYNELTSELVANPYPSNGLEIKEDGIYFDKTPYAKYRDVIFKQNDAVNYSQYTIDEIEAIIRTAKILTPGGLHEVIYNDMNSRFVTYQSVMSKLNNDYVNNIHRMVNQTVQTLYDWFEEEDPYQWVALEDEEDAG